MRDEQAIDRRTEPQRVSAKVQPTAQRLQRQTDRRHEAEVACVQPRRPHRARMPDVEREFAARGMGVGGNHRPDHRIRAGRLAGQRHRKVLTLGSRRPG
jgi:hypothetical protein